MQIFFLTALIANWEKWAKTETTIKVLMPDTICRYSPCLAASEAIDKEANEAKKNMKQMNRYVLDKTVPKCKQSCRSFSQRIIIFLCFFESSDGFSCNVRILVSRVLSFSWICLPKDSSTPKQTTFLGTWNVCQMMAMQKQSNQQTTIVMSEFPFWTVRNASYWQKYFIVRQRPWWKYFAYRGTTGARENFVRVSVVRQNPLFL